MDICSFLSQTWDGLALAFSIIGTLMGIIGLVMAFMK
jgi:hypothetical protein